jgi:hypothetical protein
MRKRKQTAVKTGRKPVTKKAMRPRVAKRSASGKAGVAVEEISFDDWLDTHKSLHAMGVEIDDGSRTMLNIDTASVGACLVPNPSGGGSNCIRTTPAACKALGGTYRGGACGG